MRKELQAKGLPTNDDMSGLILCSYYRKLKGQDLAIDQQIKDVHQFYSNWNNPEWRKKQKEDFCMSYLNGFNVGDTLTRLIHYGHNWLGEPKKNIMIEAVILDKKDLQLKLDIISFGGERHKKMAFEKIKCQDGNCWIDPYLWKHKTKQ